MQVAAVLTLLLAASASLAQPRDRVVVGMGSFPASMHPLISGQSSKNYILAVSRRAVTRFDADGNTMCQLCTEVPSVENGRAKTVDLPDGGKGMEVTFTLRPDLKWGDGTPLTTRDILFGAEVARSVYPRNYVTGVVARDERTYTVMLNAVRLDYDRVSPQPINAAVEEPIFRSAKDAVDYGNKSAFNRATTTPGLWNGPYLLAEFKPNESVTFAPNPYWDGEKPGFRQVVIRLLPSSAALEANLLSGDIDVARSLDYDQVFDLRTHYASRFDAAVIPDPLTTTYLFLQLQNPILADKRVRQAIAMGIDRKGIVDRLFNGLVAAADSIVGTSDPRYDKALTPWPYDPARARAKLGEAGWTPGPDGIMQRADGTRLSLDLVVGAGYAPVAALQQVIQSQLKQIGIEVVAKSEPFRVLDGTTLRRRTYQGMAVENHTEDPGSVPVNVFSSAGIPREATAFSGGNFTGYSNPRLDALLDAAVIELDPAKRQVM